MKRLYRVNVEERPGHFKGCMFPVLRVSDETTWRPQWKIPLENHWKRDFRDSKFQNVPRCPSPKKLVPLMRVPKPPTINYQPAT